MPAQTPCARCGTIGFVRWERIISAEESITEFFCGRCEHEWRVRDADERRKVPRPAKRPSVIRPDRFRS